MVVHDTPDIERHLRNVRQELYSGLRYCRDCERFLPAFDPYFPGAGLCGHRLRETTAFTSSACPDYRRNQ